jgi:tetratricopeptide (TPR) repeat protein
MTLSLAELLRPLSERSESVRPYVPTIGGPRLYLLLLYGAIVIGTSVEFFLSQELWYGSWEVYNTYVFAVSGLFVLFGALMLITVRGPAKDDTYWLPLPKKTVGWLGLVLLAASGLGLVAAGSSIGGWAVLLSVLMLSGFILLLLGSNGITGKDSFWLAVYGAGVVLMVLVPTHEAFDVARAAPGDYPFTGLNLFLLVTGMTASLVSLMFMNTRDGQLGAWLMGAMAIFLVSFHEQVGVLSSGTYEMYDRGLALIGITFSFLPLVIFLWREKELMSLWSKVKAATHMMASGDYKDALGQADAALQISSDAALSRKFALPWSIKADAYYAMKQYWKARSHYDIALEIDPEDSVSWCHIGNIYAFEGKRALALSSYDRAIKTDPDNAYAWNNKGAVFNSLQWPEEAHACFTRSISIMPGNFDALVNLGKVCAKMGRSDEAVGHFQAALRIMPDSTVAKDGLQKVFYKGMVMDQIHGWESMGLDTTYLRSLLEREPQDYEQKSKEFLSSIVEQKTQLTIASAGARLNVNDVIKAILKATSEHGATLDRVQKETGLTTDQLVLPMALLMKTDYVHFEKRGSHDVYVAKGKLPEAPPEPPPQEPERKHAEEPKRKDRYKLRREEHDAKQEFEPTASVLMFGRRKKPKSP